jgi:hypothetical protein
MGVFVPAYQPRRFNRDRPITAADGAGRNSARGIRGLKELLGPMGQGGCHPCVYDTI